MRFLIFTNDQVRKDRGTHETREDVRVFFSVALLKVAAPTPKGTSFSAKEMEALGCAAELFSCSKNKSAISSSAKGESTTWLSGVKSKPRKGSRQMSEKTP